MLFFLCWDTSSFQHSVYHCSYFYMPGRIYAHWFLFYSLFLKIRMLYFFYIFTTTGWSDSGLFGACIPPPSHPLSFLLWSLTREPLKSTIWLPVVSEIKGLPTEQIMYIFLNEWSAYRPVQQRNVSWVCSKTGTIRIYVTVLNWFLIDICLLLCMWCCIHIDPCVVCICVVRVWEMFVCIHVCGACVGNVCVYVLIHVCGACVGNVCAYVCIHVCGACVVGVRAYIRG